MKKSVLTFALILGAAIMVSAQVEIKPTIGFNLSKLSTEPDGFNQSARVGYELGGTVQIGKKLYFEPGIFWVKMSSELVHANDVTLNVQSDISAIRIPAFVGYQIIGGDEENIFGLRVFGGPTGSWVTKIQGNDTDLNKDNFNKFIWGIDAGAGIDVWLLFLDIGYEWGLSPVFKESVDPDKAKNNAWWWNLGVRIRF
jgi:Outer membrane protein beta-barrel domain